MNQSGVSGSSSAAGSTEAAANATHDNAPSVGQRPKAGRSGTSSCRFPEIAASSCRSCGPRVGFLLFAITSCGRSISILLPQAPVLPGPSASCQGTCEDPTWFPRLGEVSPPRASTPIGRLGVIHDSGSMTMFKCVLFDEQSVTGLWTFWPQGPSCQTEAQKSGGHALKPES